MTLFIARENNCTIYYYGAIMVMVYDSAGDDYHVHQLKDMQNADENNRILWERW